VRTAKYRVCARCDRADVRFATTWPEGSICQRCYQRATRIHGNCPSCNTPRLLPGLIGGTPTCTDCAGIPKDFRCTRCGREDEPDRVGLCAHCCLTDDLTVLLDDGAGHINQALQPLFVAFTSQKVARSARIWMIINPDAKILLRDIARGEASIAHETFTGHPQPTKVAFLRELFIEHGLLEPVHLEIERFEAWLQKKLVDTTPEQSRLIKQYARWVHVNRMQHLAQTGQLRRGTLLAARQSTSVALDFLRFLDEQNVDSTKCSQADIDRWLSTGPTTRSLARGFVRWASQHGHIRLVDFPYRLAKTAPIISQSQRIELLRRTLDPDARLTLSDRTAALLLLLYGQPLTRIAAMKLSQIALDMDSLTIRITDDVLAVPEPFANIFRQHLAALPNQNTAAHREQRWLFPGKQPGGHLNQTTIMNRLRDAGIDLRAAKNASMRALVLEIPAAIVADSFGYSYQVTDKHRRHSGATFSDYISKRTN
jgi:integrase